MITAQQHLNSSTDCITGKFEEQLLFLFVKNSSRWFERYPGNGLESCGGISGFVCRLTVTLTNTRYKTPVEVPFDGIIWVG